jgi:hypothetical protein
MDHRLSQHRIPGVLEVWRRLSPVTQAAIIKKGALNSQNLKAILATDFDKLIRSGRVFNRSHVQYLGGAEDLEKEFSDRHEGAALCAFNRKLLTKILEGEISARDPLKAAASQIQTWVARFKSQGLDGVLTNRHARPRIGIGLNQLIPLIKSIENGLIHDGQGVRHFLRQRPHARRLTLTTAERIFRNWKRLDSLPLPTRVMNFLVNYGFIHRFATVHHPEVIKALSQLPAGL